MQQLPPNGSDEPPVPPQTLRTVGVQAPSSGQCFWLKQLASCVCKGGVYPNQPQVQTASHCSQAKCLAGQSGFTTVRVTLVPHVTRPLTVALERILALSLAAP